MDTVLTPTFRYVGKTGAVLNVDDFACVDANGELVAGVVGTGLAVLGILTESGTGDGVKKFTVKLGGKVLATNDATAAVAAAHVGDPVYVFNGSTVSSNSTGTSVAGVCIGFVGTKVLVRIAG